MEIKGRKITLYDSNEYNDEGKFITGWDTNEGEQVYVFTREEIEKYVIQHMTISRTVLGGVVND